MVGSRTQLRPGRGIPGELGQARAPIPPKRVEFSAVLSLSQAGQPPRLLPEGSTPTGACSSFHFFFTDFGKRNGEGGSRQAERRDTCGPAPPLLKLFPPWVGWRRGLEPGSSRVVMCVASPDPDNQDRPSGTGRRRFQYPGPFWVVLGIRAGWEPRPCQARPAAPANEVSSFARTGPVCIIELSWQLFDGHWCLPRPQRQVCRGCGDKVLSAPLQDSVTSLSGQ